jgi:hypothetical protein
MPRADHVPLLPGRRVTLLRAILTLPVPYPASAARGIGSHSGRLFNS